MNNSPSTFMRGWTGRGGKVSPPPAPSFQPLSLLPFRSGALKMFHFPLPSPHFSPHTSPPIPFNLYASHL